MKTIISRTLNGAWVRFIDKDEDPLLRVHDFSYQFDLEDQCSNSSNFVNMFYEIVDRMGWHQDRRSREIITLKIVHGDKFEHDSEDNRKTCSICQESNQ